MAYENCCCNKLDSITQDELRTLKQTSYQKCTKQKEEWLKQCQQYYALIDKTCEDWGWFSWLCVSWFWFVIVICISWVWIRVITCLIWTTITVLYWTVVGYSSIFACGLLGTEYAVSVLNGILRTNLHNSILLGFGTTIVNNPSQKPGWGNPTFQDEFTSPTLDTNKWSIGPTWAHLDSSNYHPYDFRNLLANPSINPKEFYDPTAVEVSYNAALGSNTVKLKINHYMPPQAFSDFHDWDPAQTYVPACQIDFGIGYLMTKQFKQRHGFFEIRCKLPNSLATWPAFWLTGSLDWPPEIDIFEIYTSKSFTVFESNYHWGKENDCFAHDSDVAKHDVNNVSENFHTYGCEWDSCFIKWYYDNVLVRVAHKNVNNVFEPMWLIISNGIDDNQPNYHNLVTSPGTFEIDYVRAYSR